MMLRSGIASIVLALAFANRVQLHENHADSSKSKFGASCEELHEMFQNRLLSLQTFIDEHPQDTFSRTSQARLYMRAFGIIRTFRRARECSWVIHGESDGMDHLAAIVQKLLAGNPCAAEARAELEMGMSAETEEVQSESVMRAISVLNSEDCQVEVSDEGMGALMDEAEVNAQVDEMVNQAQDYGDNLMEDADAEAAFVQVDADMRWNVHQFFRNLGVAFLFILLALACVGVATAIGFGIGLAIGTMLYPNCAGQCGFNIAAIVVLGMGSGAVLGVGPCIYELVTQFLPRVSNGVNAVQ